MAARYALYFAPNPDSALAKFGAAILDPAASWAEQTSSARHYGFHATLKAPFELADGQNLNALKEAVKDFAYTHAPVDLADLAPRQMSGFTVLTCNPQPKALVKLHTAVVRDFDLFRRPLSEADFRRRNPDQLPGRQRENLLAYGYPYIFQDFEFHMTLGFGDLSEAADLYDQFVGNERQVCDRLAIFMQPDRKTAFSLVFSAPLGE